MCFTATIKAIQEEGIVIYDTYRGEKKSFSTYRLEKAKLLLKE